MDKNGGILSQSRPLDILAINIISVIIGTSLQYIPSITKERRGHIGSVIGVLVTILYCGWQGLFTLSSVILFTMWKILPKKIQQRTTWLTFGLIITSRLLFGFSLIVFGLPTSKTTVANTIHMFVSLRCISLMYEIRQSRTENDEVSNIAPQILTTEPSLVQCVCYFVYLPAICLGPFYTYQTYRDHIMMPAETIQKIPKVDLILKKVFQAAILITIVQALYHTVGNKLVDEIQEYKHMTLPMQYFYMLVANIIMSSSLYAMWRGGEITCVVFGLGAYQIPSKHGQGPTSRKDEVVTREWNFNTIFNGNGQLWFTEPGCAVMLRNWNTTVQWWLLRYCYTNQYLPKNMKLLRYLVVQVINASWHGSDIGYFASLCNSVSGTAIEVFYENEARKSQWKKTTNLMQRIIFTISLTSVVNIPFILGDLKRIIIFIGIAYKPTICMFVICFTMLKILTQNRPKTN